MKCTVITHEFARKSSEISPASLMITIKLMNYISSSTGFIVDANGKLLTNRDIQSITGYTSLTVKKSMVELVEQGLFTREKRGRFYVYHANPMYMFGGQQV